MLATRDSIFAQLREETNEGNVAVVVTASTNVKTSFHLAACQDFANASTKPTYCSSNNQKCPSLHNRTKAERMVSNT